MEGLHMTMVEGKTGGDTCRQRLLGVMRMVCVILAGLVIPATGGFAPAWAMMGDVDGNGKR